MNNPLIMLVDDEPHVLHAIQRLLHGTASEITALTSPQAALQKLGENNYALVISDYRMPDMDGVVFLEKCRAISPDTVRIMLTAYADLPAIMQAINRCGVTRFLTKPWNDEEVRLAVRQAVLQYELLMENRRLQALTHRQNEDLKALNTELDRRVQERTAEVVRLNQELHEGFIASIRLLAEIGEMHSAVLGHHGRRVSQLAGAIAHELQLAPPITAQVETAAMLHDIGKIGIPPAILGKQEKSLTSTEYALYKSHVLRGELITNMVPQAAWLAGCTEMSAIADTATATDTDGKNETVPLMIRWHHERYDGRGYPDGLRGSFIPKGARIIAVADAYDGIFNNREHFAATAPREAYACVEARAGTWCDPAVVTALSQVLEKMTDSNSGELEIRVAELRPGMTLAADLHTAGGILLLARNTTITPAHIERLGKYFNESGLEGWVRIQRRLANAAPNETIG